MFFYFQKNADDHSSVTALKNIPVFPALAVLFFLSACSGTDFPSYNIADKTVIRNLKISEIRGNGETWNLSCLSSVMNEKENTLKCIKPVLHLYKQGKLSATITGKTGILNTISKKSFIKTDVKVSSEMENLSLFSKELFFDSGKSRIWSYSGVRVIRNDIETRASGFTAKPDLSKITFINHETKKI